MHPRWWWAIGLGACDGGDPPTETADDGAPEDTDVAPEETGADSGSAPEEEDLGCYADWVWDFEDDGSTDGTGYDQYDAVRTDLLIHVERHFEAGNFHYSADYAYDADGNIISFARDEDDNGTVDYRVTYFWDDAGYFIGADFDQDGDGTIDYAFQYVRDVEGKRLSATEDQDGDGETDRWYAYTYDSVDRITQLTGDDENDGAFEYMYTVSYSDPTLVSGTAFTDEENDGVVDETELFESDIEGRLVYSEVDLLVDGYLDLIESFLYDAVTGVLVEEDSEEHEAPPDQDNVSFRHKEYQYDDMLRLVVLWNDVSEMNDGIPNEYQDRETWTFAGTCP